MKYKIIRFFKDKDKRCKVIKEGQTLEQAREHCNDPKSAGEGWFDGFINEVMHKAIKEES